LDVFRNLVRGRLAAGEAQRSEHLSADLLTAFQERTLPGAQRGRVFSHLGICSTCREALVLSMPELAPEMGALVSRPKVSIWHFPAALRWGSAAAALVVAIGAGVLVEHHSLTPRVGTTVARTLPSQPSEIPEQPGTAVRQNPAADVTTSQSSGRMKHGSRTAPHFASSGVIAGAAIDNPTAGGARNTTSTRNDRSEIAAMPAPRPTGEPETRATVDVAAAAGPVAERPTTESKSSEGTLQAATQQPSALASKSVSAYSLSAVPGQAKSRTGAIARWTVSSSGQLLRNAPGGVIANIEPAPGMVFRAVAADGIEVWAGGAEGNSNGVLSEGRGVLFHSSDAGETWKQAEGPWRRVVSHVMLDGPGLITVTANDGSWKSSDGGQSWTTVQ
jgi:hypothetical protein